MSCETPEYTANADGLGALRLLEAIRILMLERRLRFYQASTSELCGQGSFMLDLKIILMKLFSKRAV